MKAINKLLCIIIATASGCNTNGTHPAGNYDSSTSPGSVVKTGTVPPADSALRAQFSAVKADNLNCPVCRKTVVNCVEDTASYMGKLIGFDNPQCKAEFAKNPGSYRIDYK